MDKVSYALGLSIASQFKATGIEQLDVESFKNAITAAMEGKDAEMSSEEASKVLNDYFAKLQEKMQSKMAEMAVQNEILGKEYLKKNGSKEGVITTASGLQYEIINEGTGKKPELKDTVKCHYHGTLIDGTVFDSSVQRGEPAQFPLQGVIPGWTEVLQLMPVGSKWKVTIPSNLAYGERGAGRDIMPNSTLIFEIELLDII